MQACLNEEALRYLTLSIPKAFWEIFGLRLAEEVCIEMSPHHERIQRTIQMKIPLVPSPVDIGGRCKVYLISGHDKHQDWEVTP